MIILPNSFGLTSYANCIKYIYESSSKISEPWFILGSGTNTILSDTIDKTCLKAADNSIKIISDTKDQITIEVGAALNWHKFVITCLNNSWFGLENLISIPGTVGAAPIQNIGAYGCEVANKIKLVKTFQVQSARQHCFTNLECEFDYRSSIFKTKLKDHIITNVQFIMEKSFSAIISHPNLTPTNDAKMLAKQITNIRNRKLPDITIIGNAGSFFKNPIVSTDFAAQINNIPKFAITKDLVKLSAAALIEQTGLKGHSIGGAAVSTQHALVIINRNQASYLEVKALAKDIQEQVFAKFKVKLKPEVNFVE